MEFLTDWKFWLFLISILGMIVNFLTHIKLTTNDLKHLAIDLKEIKSEQKCMKEKIISLGEDVSRLKGKIE
jgi:hypothetical protein